MFSTLQGNIQRDFTLGPSSTVASTFNPSRYLQSLEISNQISCGLREIKRKAVGITTRYCIKRSPSCDLSSLQTSQYGFTDSGTLSVGHPDSTSVRSSVCSLSVAAAMRMHVLEGDI